MAIALITLDEFALFTGTTTADKSIVNQSASLTQLIQNASDYISRYCNREFDSKQRTIYATLFNDIVLPVYPVASIDAVYFDDSRAFGANSLLDTSKYSCNLDNGILSFFCVPDALPNPNNLKIIFTAGYSTIPSDLKDACVKLVKWNQKRITADQFGVRSSISGEITTNFIQDVPWEIKNALQPYVRYA